MGNYIKKRWPVLVLTIVLVLSYNLYFIFLMQEKDVKYLYYLDGLLLLPLLLLLGRDYYHYWKREQKKASMMQQEDLIYDAFPQMEDWDIAEHDIGVLKRELQTKFEENCDLQDYVAKWCHEIKIPLAASLLIDDRIKDAALRRELRGQLEKMNQQVSSMLLGCKLQGDLFDLQIHVVNLPDCVKTSIKNNQFFLIQKGFALDIKVEDLRVYTDPAWLVYVLDQLINNAVKYATENPRLLVWTGEKEEKVLLFVEDRGEGILEQDIRRIFEKGFTGANYHNGKYKSTGMGLYMVSKIMERLGHEIHVESEYGKFTRFVITF